MSKPVTASNGAQTLDRGLGVLEELARARGALGITELAERCGLDKSTVHRLVVTLVVRGYVKQNPRTREYALGLKLFDLYDSLQESLGLQEACRPLLNELADTSGETSHLAVLEGADVVFVDKVATQQVMGVRTIIGRREPAHCTALGKAVLAALPEPQCAALLAGRKLQAFTDKTPVTREALERELALTKRRGWALDNEEYLLGVRCLAAAVVDRAGHPVGVLGISGPATRLSAERCEELGPYVCGVAARASAALGRTPGEG